MNVSSSCNDIYYKIWFLYIYIYIIFIRPKLVAVGQQKFTCVSSICVRTYCINFRKILQYLLHKNNLIIFLIRTPPIKNPPEKGLKRAEFFLIHFFWYFIAKKKKKKKKNFDFFNFFNPETAQILNGPLKWGCFTCKL